MTMAMTIATMGRLMKKRYMAATSPGRAGSVLQSFGTAASLAAELGQTASEYHGLPCLTFWTPSTTTRSPGFSPSSITQREPTRFARLDRPDVHLVVGCPTTATW